jgi:imidazole glycerol-phosphate synthase subunit HisH
MRLSTGKIMKIAIIDYEMGNIKSVENAFKSLGASISTTRDISVINKCSAVVLPGVGAFRDAVANLDRFDLGNLIRKIIMEGKPFLGICIGLQVLLEYGTEGGVCPGLGIFKGTVEKIPLSAGVKIPHMGWNKIKIIKTGSRLFKGIKQFESFYFVHSYHVKPDDPELINSTTEYGTELVSGMERGNCFGVQFHPEKSSSSGLCILKNFIEIAGGSGKNF